MNRGVKLTSTIFFWLGFAFLILATLALDKREKTDYKAMDERFTNFIKENALVRKSEVDRQNVITASLSNHSMILKEVEQRFKEQKPIQVEIITSRPLRAIVGVKELSKSKPIQKQFITKQMKQKMKEMSQ